ncbi:MAG: amino-acid N-acetyltransferase [Pseudomonadota bacterium]
MSENQPYVKWFRDSSPYINAHRNRTFVLYLGGATLDHDNFPNIVSDIVLLHSLGVKLVVVHGAAPQIDQHLAALGLTTAFVDGIRVTTAEVLPAVQYAIGKIRTDVEARLSMGLVNSPLHGSDIVVTSGNFLRARPFGVRDGVDYCHTGEVRRVNANAIRRQLDSGAIVLVSPLGYSPAGEVFNINSLDVAAEVAIALMADKLVFFTEDDGVRDEQGEVISELQVSAIPGEGLDQLSPLAQAKRACVKGVPRCHLISHHSDGALLEELFTRDGAGTQVTRQSYEQIRAARPDDVAGIIELITPLEAEGVLVKRPRELLESEISHFTVIERDGMIVSCAALYPFNDRGELACLATHPDYRNNDRGERLLQQIEANARAQHMKAIFVLTTRTAHWFLERGFTPTRVEDLPDARRNLYNWQRNSKLFEKRL